MGSTPVSIQQATAAPMFAPDGNVRLIPNDQVSDAVKAGGELAVPMRDPKGDTRYVRHSEVADALRAGGRVDWSDVPQAHHEGFWKAFGGDIFGMAKGFAQQVQDRAMAPVTGVAGGVRALAKGDVNTALSEFERAAQPDVHAGKQLAEQTVQEDALRKKEGRSIPYRAVAPLGNLIGANVRGMEDAANEGDTAGVAGHAAAPIGVIAAAETAKVPAVRRTGARVASAVANLPETIARQVPSTLGDTITNPRMAHVPAEGASPAELKAYADANGIPLNAAQATEHNFPRNLQSTGERAGVGGTGVRNQAKAAQAAVSQHAENLMNEFSPDTADAASAGQKLKDSVAKALEKEQEKARRNYTNVDQVANGTTTDAAGATAQVSEPTMVDARALKAEAQNINGETSFMRKTVPTGTPKRAIGLVQDLLAKEEKPAASPGEKPTQVDVLPDQITFEQAQQIRSRLLDEARHPDTAISSEAQAWLKRLSGTLDASMESAAKATPELEQAFRGANEHWKALQEHFNSPRSPLYQILQEPDPSKVPQKLAAKGQIGGSPYNAELLDRYGIDKGPLKWMITRDMLNKNFSLHGGKVLAGYSDEFLNKIFTPDELGHVYKTGAIARSVGLNTNPSGTAAVNSAVEDVTSIGRGKLKVPFSKAAAAKLTKSKVFNDWLMNNPAPPTTDIPKFRSWLQSRHEAMLAAAGLSLGSQKESVPTQ